MSGQHKRVHPAANQRERPRLNVDLVLERVRALGLDDRDVTRHVGLSLTDLQRGPHPGAVTLDLLGRLCGLLDVEAAALITNTPPAPTQRRRRTPPRGTRPAAPAERRWGDGGTVLAVLLTAGRSPPTN